MQCHRHWDQRGEMRIVTVLKGTLRVHEQNYVTSLVILRLAQVGRRSCRRYVRKTLRNRMVVWTTAIITYLPVLLFPSINDSNVRLYAHDVYLADVRLWGRQARYCGHAMSPLLNTRVTLLREAYATAFGRGCQAIMQTVGGTKNPA